MLPFLPPLAAKPGPAPVRRSINALQRALPWVLAGGAALASPAAEFGLTVRNTRPVELSWSSEPGFEYRVESSPSLAAPDWKPLAAARAGDGSTQSITVPADLPALFFRGVRNLIPTVQISPQAVDPTPGQVYPASTILGSAPLGLQFTVPSAWKGGVREGSSTLLFASDTEPGLVIGFISLSGTAASSAAALGTSFAVGQFGGFQVNGTPQIQDGVLTILWDGVGFDDQFNSLSGLSARCVATVHPSGGLVAFVGFHSQANAAVMDRVLGDFRRSVVTVPRKTRTDIVQLLAGKAFVWVKSSNTGNGGNSGSLQRWTEKNAFFCSGTYDITTRSESSYSGNLSGGGFYTGGSSSSSSETGDWTVIDTDAGPAMVMISSSGTDAALLRIEGNSVFFGAQQFDFIRPHACPGP